jgi:hypothetical protein
MTTSTMNDRLRRVSAAARRKMIEALEKEAAKKKAPSKPKSESFPEDKAQAKQTAVDKRSPSKELSKVKPTNKRDKVTPRRKEEVADKGTPKKTKQKALDEADKKRKELTSETPPLKSTPKPKVKAKIADAGDARKAKIAELRRALMEDLDTRELDEGDLGSPLSKNQVAKENAKGSDAQRKPVFQLYEMVKGKLPAIQQALATISKANDGLENAVMSNDVRQMRAALSLLLDTIRKNSKALLGELVPVTQTIRKVFDSLGQAKAASAGNKFADEVTASYKLVAKLNHEVERAKTLSRMAAPRAYDDLTF